MSNGNTNPDEPTDVPQGPGSRHMKPWHIAAVAIYLVLISGLVLYGLIKLWPYPTPAGTPDQTPAATASPSPAQSPQTANGGAGTTNKQRPAGVLPDPEPISFFGGRFQAIVYLETRLFLLVMLAGALGS